MGEGRSRWTIELGSSLGMSEAILATASFNQSHLPLPLPITRILARHNQQWQTQSRPKRPTMSRLSVTMASSSWCKGNQPVSLAPSRGCWTQTVCLPAFSLSRFSMLTTSSRWLCRIKDAQVHLREHQWNGAREGLRVLLLQ